MTGTARLLRIRQRAIRAPWPRHITRAQTADLMRVSAGSLLAYAEHPDARASALHCLDMAEQLDQRPRAGWYPRRPRAWRP